MISYFDELDAQRSDKTYSNVDQNDMGLNKIPLGRRELDRVIFEALGLTEEEQLRGLSNRG